MLQPISLSLWAVLQIFLLDMEGGYRGHASGQKWHEDLQWAHRLDEGWNLAAVKQVSCQKSPFLTPVHAYKVAYNASAQTPHHRLLLAGSHD